MTGLRYNDSHSCEDCTHWNPMGSDDVGECRRHAPIIVQRSNVWTDGHWPITSPDDWCGEHEYQPPPKDQP